jgi:signal transduction histidine kinase
VRETLRRVELFSALDDADLDRLLTRVERVELEPGELLFEEGAVGDRAYVVESGELEILKKARNRELLVTHSGPGAVIGEMAILQAMPRSASVRAATTSHLLAIDGDAFRVLIEESPHAARAMLETMADRWRETDMALQESDKLAQLGSLSAGVAHELNNPAAAIARASASLKALVLTDTGLLPPAWASLAGQLGERPVMSSLARSDAEDAVEDALDAAGVDEPWEFAATLVDLGVAPDAVEGFIAGSTDPGGDLAALARRHEAASLAGEIADAAGRISEIVGALRSYTYLDRGEKQDVDVNRGLADTLVMLRSKLRGVDIVTDYGSDLPSVEGSGGELNQVWTNLIANAADALDGSGTLTVKTECDGPWVLVHIGDDGPGIPPDLVDRIFEPFFTTKPIGQGTGIGLDISRHIVQEKHGGAITVTSEPGSTTFMVRLPVG